MWSKNQLKIAQDSMIKYVDKFHPKWEPEPTKKPASEFQRNHIPVYKADIESPMQENPVHSRVWVGTALVTQCIFFSSYSNLY